MKIFINNLVEISSTKYSIGFQHNMPFDTTNGMKKDDGTLYTEAELKALGGKIVDYTGDFTKQRFYNPITNTLFSEDADLTTVKQNKINEMTQAYENEIYGTFQSSAFDGKTQETYSCSQTDQVRINGEVTMAMAVKAGFSTETISWKNLNQDKCVIWKADAMIKLGTDLHKFITVQTDYLVALKVYINSLTNIDDVNKVTWGMTIPNAAA